MGEAQGIQLLVLLFVLSIVAGAIALAVSPELRAELRDQVMRRLAGLAGGARWLQRWMQTQLWRRLSMQPAPGLGAAPPAQRTKAMPLNPDDPLGRPKAEPLPWMRAGAHPAPTYGVAADQPPTGLASLLRQHEWFDQRGGFDPLRFSIGWRVRQNGGLLLECGTFSRGRQNSVVNVLNSGQIGSGKDVLLRSMLLVLLLRNSPDDLNLVIIDGKGLDYVGYAGLPHLVALANDIPDIPPALEWLDGERERRKTLLREAGAKNWHEAADPKPFPFLLVYISELTTLERFVERFWEWANDHLSLDRALGICYIIGTQTASNTPTRWRRQMQLFVAGYQPSTDDDRPNTNIGVGGWPEGVVPPSGLPLGGGYFTAVLGRAAFNVRSAFISDEEERQALDVIRRRWGVAPARESVSVRRGVPTEARRGETGANDRIGVGSPYQYDAGSPDTGATNGGSVIPVTAAPVRQDMSRAELLALVASEPLSRAETVRLLALQRKPDNSDWAYSANKIADLVGGTRATILEMVKEAREARGEVTSEVR
ncbi:FtsK/SpoIIIE domain-containing protein [Chloroflexus sp.]|uniref:FtsK/SpoIIIE domain-containing protein n=1 Tax=Chloroflexus sp. TaxID=1904827 RepID=UPI002ACEA10D|nr:FtsK/SpoIIIE domain-containing protein [Chloroflexus sp.]